MKKIYYYACLLSICIGSISVFVTRCVVLTLNQANTVYVLGSNITLSSATADTAILITASGITLDCNRRLISQGNFIAGGDAITVSPFLNNITIRNGIIQNFTNRGIVVGQGCTNIVVDSMLTDSCDFRAVEAIGTSLNPIDSITVRNSKINYCSQGGLSTDVVFFQQCLKPELYSLNFENNGISLHNLSVVHMLNCSQGRISSCDIKASTGSLNVYGYDMSTIQDFIFERCTMRHGLITSAGGTVVGYDLRAGTTSSDVIFQDCISLDNTATVGVGSVIGFNIESTSTDITLEHCKAIDLVATGTVKGFAFSSSSNCFVNNGLAKDLIAATGDAQGFVLTGTATDIKLINCQATELTATNGQAIGFLLSPSTACSLLQCVSINNIGAVGVGYDVVFCTDCTFQNNSANLNQGNSSNNSYGFRINLGNSLLPDIGSNIFMQNQAINNGLVGSFVVNNQMDNFNFGTSDNWNSNATSSLTWPFTNVGIVP